MYYGKTRLQHLITGFERDPDCWTSFFSLQRQEKLRVEKTMLFYVQSPIVYIFLITLLVRYTVHSEESCYQYRRKANVTLDTDQCLWQNFTEQKLKRHCLQSCINNNTVRVYKWFSWKLKIIMMKNLKTGEWGLCSVLWFTMSFITLSCDLCHWQYHS